MRERTDMYKVKITLEDEPFRTYEYYDKEQMIQDILYGDLYIFNELPFKIRIFNVSDGIERPVMIKCR